MERHTLPRTQAALRRLLAIDWTPVDARLRSHVALLREYLRRSALWAAALDRTDAWPWLDLAACLDPEASAPERLLAELRHRLATAGVSAEVGETCTWYLRWVALAERATVPPEAAYGLPAPYEPLVRCYERGGRWYGHHGFVYVGHVGIPTTAKGWHTHARPEPVVPLDDAALDALDGGGRGADQRIS